MGLLGPWISGGIEFNGRNTIARPPLCPLISPSKPIRRRTDGVGRRNGADARFTGVTGFTLRPDRAALEIASRVYTATPRRVISCGGPTRQ